MGEKFRYENEFLPPSLEVPAALHRYEQFVVWKFAIIDGKIRKPPYDPKNGQHASLTNPGLDPERWLSRNSRAQDATLIRKKDEEQ